MDSSGGVWRSPAERKNDFLAELAAVCAKIINPYVIDGDFSILCESGDKNKKLTYSQYTDSFSAIIQSLNLREIIWEGESIPGPINKNTLHWRNWIESS